MATYLVDYENVNKSGLLGMETLPEENTVVIFYSDEEEAIPVYLIDSSSARIEYRRVVVGTSNALDFQLVGYLFHEMKPEEVYYIISKDTGYDMIVPMAKSFGNTIIRKSFIGENDEIWENSASYLYVKSKMDLFQKKDINEKIRNICGIYGIKDAAKVNDPDKYDLDADLVDIPLMKKISNLVENKTGTTPSNETVSLLIRGLAGCENKQDFYLFCIRNMGETVGLNFYKSVKSSFEEMFSAVKMAS